MESKLISVRIKSFVVSLCAYAVIGITAFLASPDFASLVTEHFGNTAITSLVLLVVPEVAKHLRNLVAIKKLGAIGEVELI